MDKQEVLKKLNACFFFIKVDEWFKKHNKIWDKVSSSIKNTIKISKR